MIKFVIKIAGLNIEINSNYDYSFNMCKDYIVDSKDYDFSVKCSDIETDLYTVNSNREYGEFIAIYEQIAKNLYKYNRFLMHGAAFSYNNKAYLIIAPSGVGKTTHLNNLLSCFKDIKVINGDKPIIDIDGFVYGTPWAGKEKYNNNVSFKIDSLIILERGDNSIKKVEKSLYLKEILNAIYKCDTYDLSLEIADKAFKDVSIYKIVCGKEKDSAYLTYNEVLNK